MKIHGQLYEMNSANRIHHEQCKLSMAMVDFQAAFIMTLTTSFLRRLQPRIHALIGRMVITLTAVDTPTLSSRMLVVMPTTNTTSQFRSEVCRYRSEFLVILVTYTPNSR